MSNTKLKFVPKDTDKCSHTLKWKKFSIR